MEIINIPTEQTTAATDLLLALVAVWCAALVARLRPRNRWKANLWASIFILLAVAAFFGAIVHGFKMSPTVHNLLWKPINLSLGMVVSLFVCAAIYDWLGEDVAQRTLRPLLSLGFGFFVATLFVEKPFFLFLPYEAVGLLFTLVVYIRLASRRHNIGAKWMAAALILTLVAGLTQASRAIHFTFIWEFDHRSTFHIVQMISLPLMVLAVQESLRVELPYHQ